MPVHTCSSSGPSSNLQATRSDRLRSLRPTRALAALATSAALALLAGCASLEPLPLTEADMTATYQGDRARAALHVPPLPSVMTLEEAIARALKFNLDRRTRQIEEVVAGYTLDVSSLDLLPKLVAQAGYRNRDADLIVRSSDSVTGEPSLANPSISSERSHVTSGLVFTWSALDFGTSYFQARQNADRSLIAAERRRKATHMLIQDVRTAFWRTAGAQRLQSQIRDTIGLAEEALADARKAEAERVRSPLDSLRYQRQLLESLRLLEATNQELAAARIELQQLVNLPLAVDLKVSERSAAPGRAMLDLPMERLELLASTRNADHREQAYNLRIANDEARKALTRMFPGLTLDVGARYDTDNYLIHQRWNDAGLTLSFNLMNLLSLPVQKRLADAGIALAEQRRVASQMALLAQVHIARLNYGNALQQYLRADAVAEVDNRISGLVQSREAAQVQSKLELVANQTTAILSQLRRYQALAQAHAAAGRLQATLGLDLALGDTLQVSLPVLTASVGKSLDAWDRGQLADAAGGAQ
jgi:outer membrane protein TolC